MNQRDQGISRGTRARGRVLWASALDVLCCAYLVATPWLPLWSERIGDRVVSHGMSGLSGIFGVGAPVAAFAFPVLTLAHLVVGALGFFSLWARISCILTGLLLALVSISTLVMGAVLADPQVHVTGWFVLLGVAGLGTLGCAGVVATQLDRTSVRA